MIKTKSPPPGPEVSNDCFPPLLTSPKAHQLSILYENIMSTVHTLESITNELFDDDKVKLAGVDVDGQLRGTSRQ